MPTYYCDDGNAELEIEAESAEDAAREYVEGGDWTDDSGRVERTCWIHVHTEERIQVAGPGDAGPQYVRGEREWHTIAVQSEAPPCPSDEGEHDWRSPHHIVGGIAENPGVWGHGGGVIIHECCMRCGTGRTTDTWAQDPETGEQGLRSIAYQPAGHYEIEDHTRAAR